MRDTTVIRPVRKRAIVGHLDALYRLFREEYYRVDNHAQMGRLMDYSLQIGEIWRKFEEEE